MAEASLLSFPFPSCPARSLFLSPKPPHNTKASPQDKEASAEERGKRLLANNMKDQADVKLCKLGGGWRLVK